MPASNLRAHIAANAAHDMVMKDNTPLNLTNPAAGTIVTFDDPDLDSGRMVATWMPGGVEYGELQDLAWSDAYGSEWELDDILRGNPAVLKVIGDHTLDHPVPGMVVTFDSAFDEGLRLVATLAPGNVSDSGELLYLTWSDVYGGHHPFDAIVAGNPTVISKPLSEVAG